MALVMMGFMRIGRAGNVTTIELGGGRKRRRLMMMADDNYVEFGRCV